MKLYDRPFKLPVILDLSKLSPEEVTTLVSALEEDTPVELSYPAEHAIEVSKDLAAKGWPSLARPLPLHVAPTECMQIFAQSLKRFNQHAHLLRNPDTSVINKSVESTADFERIVDDLTSQQDETTLSQIFGTADRTSNVYWTTRTTLTNSKLSDNVIGVAKLGDSEKAVENRIKGLKTQIRKALEATLENERVTFKDHGSQNFQYR